MEALNRIMDTYKERCKCLEDITRDGVLQMTNVIQAQEIYIKVVSELVATLHARMEEFEDTLPLDKEYDLILPVEGEEGYRFRPENINKVHDRIKDVWKKAIRALVKFKHNQSPDNAALIEDAALCFFLKGSDTEKAYLRMI